MRSETPLSPFHLVNSQSVGSLSHPSLQITGKTEEAGLHRLRKTRSGERDLFALKGHDFSRADKANKISGALAPEGRALRDLILEFKPFSAVCLAPEVTGIPEERRKFVARKFLILLSIMVL